MNGAVRLHLALRALYGTIVGVIPIVAVLFVHAVYFGVTRNPVMLIVLQVYCAIVIVFSILHLVPLSLLSHGRRVHNWTLLILVVLAYGLFIWIASLQMSTPVYGLFAVPVILMLCYHAIENDVHAG